VLEARAVVMLGFASAFQRREYSTYRVSIWQCGTQDVGRGHPQKLGATRLKTARGWSRVPG